MPTLHHVSDHFRRYGLQNRQLYIVATMLLFWGIFEGIVAYTAPLLILQNGLSRSSMGIIMASGPIFGALFDLGLTHYLKNHHYRRMFLFMLILSVFYPILLFSASSFWLFVLAMALWGLFYDLKNFGRFDFVARRSKSVERSSSFGVIGAFSSIGYIFAPLIASLTITGLIGWNTAFAAFVFLVIAVCFYFALLAVTKRDKSWQSEENSDVKKNFILELSLWTKIGIAISPILLLTLLLNVVDAVFWTLGPIISQGFNQLGHFGGLILTAYQLPIILVGWFIGSFTSRFGKKRTAFLAFGAGSAVLTLVGLLSSPWLVLVTVFIASTFFAIAWPSINGAYADYLAESPSIRGDIEGVEDFFSNSGYVIGPLFAGFASEVIGNLQTFTALGIFGLICTFILMRLTPRKINLEKAIEKLEQPFLVNER